MSPMQFWITLYADLMVDGVKIPVLIVNETVVEHSQSVYVILLMCIKYQFL